MRNSSRPLEDASQQASSARRQQSGFALLLIFLMAAVIAISLYMEIPRVAFDTQRQKEQLLMFRGEQYKRAIQVFLRANQRWPAKIEDLENTNNRRYLRQRYIDPMTGKDEWRMIHIQNGVLTDSKVQNKQQQQQDKDTTTAIGQTVGLVAGLGFNTTDANGQAAFNPANRRRASDNPSNGGAGTPGSNSGTDPNAPGGGSTGATGSGAGLSIPPAPGTVATGQSGIPGMPPGVMMPGLPVPGQSGTSPGMPGLSGSNLPMGGITGTSNSNGGSSPSFGYGSSPFGGSGSTPFGSSTSSQPTPGQQGYSPGTPGNSVPGGVSPMSGSPYSTAAGANGGFSGFQQPGMSMNPQAQSAAAGMINSLLTQPRPGGIPTTGTTGMATMGGGIAGFASKADEDSIMIYNEQKNYGLWEFIFDPNKVKPLPNPNTGAVGTPVAQIGSQIGTPATQVGTPAGQMGNPAGPTPGPGQMGPGMPPTPAQPPQQ